MSLTATSAPMARRRLGPGPLAITLAVIAALLLAIGGALVTIHLTQRDGNGYFSASKFQLAASGYAISSEQLHLAGRDPRSLARDAADLSGSLRVQATSTDGKPVFIGIARQFDADRYLEGVARDEVVDAAGANTTTVPTRGIAPPVPRAARTSGGPRRPAPAAAR